MFRRLAPLLIVALLAAPAAGQSAPDVQRLDTERRDKERERDDLRGEAATAAQQVEALRARLVGLARAQSGEERQAASKRARFEILNTREQALSLRMSRNRAKLTRLLSALQLYSRNPPPALLVAPRKANDAVRAAILMRAIAPELARRAAALKAEAETFQRSRRETALAHESLFTTESEVADRRAEIERLIAEKTALEQRLYTDADAADAEAKALAARVQSLGGLVRELGARDQPATTQSMTPRLARLLTPVQGTRIRGFGVPSPSGGRNEGVTWRSEPEAQVLAPAAARVEFAGALDGWGQVVVLSLGDGWHVVLAGMDRISAKVGRSVAAGEPIGRMGSGGKPSPELYMELRQAGAPVDPAGRLDAG
jgi:septal ring factor EnvC (AmiA/AmiB activator)